MKLVKKHVQFAVKLPLISLHSSFDAVIVLLEIPHLSYSGSPLLSPVDLVVSPTLTVDSDEDILSM